ncbi:MAG TPA: hypothetical protein PK986_01340 [Spirochaetota bacterium]|nr:hypothetical protein [Spirochaetota bacterium]HQO39088.1 hypothetical protein [Spirochaetota bacterium]
MKYSMVRQFSNASIDNIFIFFWKIVDFGKLLIEVWWGFYDIIAAFFLIFYNFFMYIYYLFLFIIDRGSESGGPVTMATRSRSTAKSKIPSVLIDKTPTPIPAMFRTKSPSTISSSTANLASTITAKTSESVQAALKPVKSSPSGTGAKSSFFKSMLEFLADIFITIKDFIVKPAVYFKEFLSGKLTPVRETDQKTNETSGKGSLIDDYLKEYEKQRKKK